MRGIDVSSYQGVIDWTKVAVAGVEFAILKVIRKDLQPDNQFERNWSECSAAGIPVQGVYNYSYATTVEKARGDARKVLEILGGRKTMVWLDVEDKCQAGIGQTLIDIIKAYGEVITGAGCSFGVYTGLSYYNSYIKPYAAHMQYPFWIARYPHNDSMTLIREPAANRRPAITHDLWGWQYTSKGQVPGIAGNVDLNELYVELTGEALKNDNAGETPADDRGNTGNMPEEMLHKVGETVTVSSYYKSSTDPVEKAIIRGATGTIIKVKAGVHNPYCIGRTGVAIGWCNDGDIRTGGVQAAEVHEVYTVRPGDTLSAIAKAHGSTVARLQQINGIKNVNRIYVGQRIKI